MTHVPPPVLEFPAMLHGLTTTVRARVRAEGRRWAREYARTGTFTPPRQLLPVPPGEVLFMFPGLEGDLLPRPLWRVGMFGEVSMNMGEGVPSDERPRMRESFESFCLGTPWGALDQVVSPLPPRSAANMARRLAALLRFWDVLQGPRYSYRIPDTHHTLDALVDFIFRVTLEAWCPRGPASIREHLTLAVDRMTHASREDSIEAVLRVVPVLVKAKAQLKHPEVLSDPGFLREHLALLPPGDFDDISSASLYTVTTQLAIWDLALSRH